MNPDDLLQRIQSLARMDLHSAVDGGIIAPASIAPEDLCQILRDADWVVKIDPTDPRRLSIQTDGLPLWLEFDGPCVRFTNCWCLRPALPPITALALINQLNGSSLGLTFCLVSALKLMPDACVPANIPANLVGACFVLHCGSGVTLRQLEGAREHFFRQNNVAMTRAHELGMLEEEPLAEVN